MTHSIRRLAPLLVCLACSAQHGDARQSDTARAGESRDASPTTATSRSAESSITLGRDADGCPTVHTVSRTFTSIHARLDSAWKEPIVLAEDIDLTKCEHAEGE